VLVLVLVFVLLPGRSIAKLSEHVT